MGRRWENFLNASSDMPHLPDSLKHKGTRATVKLLEISLTHLSALTQMWILALASPGEYYPKKQSLATPSAFQYSKTRSKIRSLEERCQTWENGWWCFRQGPINPCTTLGFMSLYSGKTPLPWKLKLLWKESICLHSRKKGYMISAFQKSQWNLKLCWQMGLCKK